MRILLSVALAASLLAANGAAQARNLDAVHGPLLWAGTIKCRDHSGGIYINVILRNSQELLLADSAEFLAGGHTLSDDQIPLEQCGTIEISQRASEP